MFAQLPGGDIIEQGLLDLKEGNETEASWLTCILAPHLQRCGIELPPLPAVRSHDDWPEMRLYRLLCITEGANAYSHYNQLRRRGDKFRRALEQNWVRRCQAQPSQSENMCQ